MGRRFVVALLLIAVSGLALRATYVVLETQDPDVGLYDAAYYKTTAQFVADGEGFSHFTREFDRPLRREPTAAHPPMTTVLLAPIAFVWGATDFALGLEMAVLGAVNVVLIGLLGVRLRSPRCGLIAAAIAAIYPCLWANDALPMSETPTVTILVLSLFATYRLLSRWSTRDALVLGGLCGLAVLTRGELVLLLPAVAAGVMIQRAGPRRPRRAGLMAVAAVATVVVIAPWVAYNLARFREPVLISTNLDVALWGSSCDEVFYGPGTGFGTTCPEWDTEHGDQQKAFLHFLRLTSLERNRVRRDLALEYLGDHIQRYPVVVAARAGRTWALFRPFDLLDYETYEGRPRWVSQAALAFYYPLLFLAVWGAFEARKRVPLWPLLVPAIIATLGAFVSLGLPRYRTIAEPVIVVLAAIAIDEAVRRRLQRDGPTDRPERHAAGTPARP